MVKVEKRGSSFAQGSASYDPCGAPFGRATRRLRRGRIPEDKGGGRWICHPKDAPLNGGLNCAKREKGGMGGGLAHTADSGIASALPQGAERTTTGGHPRTPDGTATASVRQQGARRDLRRHSAKCRRVGRDLTAGVAPPLLLHSGSTRRSPFGTAVCCLKDDVILLDCWLPEFGRV